MPNLKDAAWYGAGLSREATGGNFYYVDGNNGLDTNPGTDPAYPLLTITYALSLCVDDHDDYIIVIDYPETHPGGDEDSPININKNRVHVLGANSPYGRGDQQQYLCTPNVAAPVFEVSARWVEIAYFKLAGGTLFGCILLSGAIENKGLAIHHCQFGEKINGTAGPPTYGIDCLTIGCGNWLYVGDCQFYETILSHGIVMYNPAQVRIERNMFSQVGGDGINFVGQAGYPIVADNYFACSADTAGKGINVTNAAGALQGGFFANNMANWSKGDMTQVPWVDPDAGVAKNAWMGNMLGITLTHPA